jgi:hypothetical protein
MREGLKEHQIAGLVNRINKELHLRMRLPDSLRCVISSAVMDYLKENGLMHGEPGRNPHTDGITAFSEDNLRNWFEQEHRGRRLERGHPHGTYRSPQIAAIWNQTVATFRWMMSVNPTEMKPYPTAYCIGSGDDRCQTCLYGKTWELLQESTVVNRVAQIEEMERKNEKLCHNWHGEFYIRVIPIEK